MGIKNFLFGKKKEETSLQQFDPMSDKAIDALEDENAALRQRVEELEQQPAAITLVTDRHDSERWSTRARITKLLGIDAPPGAEASDEAILEVLERLRGPASDGDEGALAKRNETLAEAVHHNKGQRAELDDRLTQSKNIVNRIGAIMGVDRWNTDGDEIIEKVQRFSTFKHWLKKRLLTAADRVKITSTEPFTADVVASLVVVGIEEEIRTILAALVGDAQLAKLLQNSKAKATPTVLDLAENQPPAPAAFAFQHEDIAAVEQLLNARTGASNAHLDELGRLFLELRSAGVAADLVAFMNTVVVPALAKLRGPARSN